MTLSAPREGTARASVAVICLLALAACRCAGSPPATTVPPTSAPPTVTPSDALADQMTETVTQLVAALERDPGLVPSEPDDTTPVVMLFANYRPDRTTSFVGPFAAPGGSLGLARSRAAARTRPPESWIVMTDEKATRVLYWAPVGKMDRLRVELPVSPDSREIRGTTAGNPGDHVVVRLPFFPDALVVLYSPKMQVDVDPAHILQFPPEAPTSGPGDEG